MAGADLAFALQLADLADSLSLPRFRAGDLRVDTKPDLTPVTDADRAVERALRERIALKRPGEGVLGEEEGDDGGDVRWIVDPIDGTRNFSRGLPVWATLIALERDGVLTAAVVSAPALGRRWWAALGEGAFADGEPIRVSRVSALRDASVSCTHARDLALLEPRVWHARGLGDFWQHVLVAEGALDAAVDTELSLWDAAAVELVVTEAGGRASGPDGSATRPDEQLVTTNGLVHDEVLALLRDR
ncbi:MAG TPA: inositol monophosphatase family protein [Gaiellaceae bacterium]|nr:inositol monophosphatase family protein [Gaiellaceae bacterium]